MKISLALLTTRGIKRALLVAAALLSVNAWPGETATYYVQTGGTGTNCTQAQNIATPRPTIANGVACLANPGDILYIRAGTYAVQIDQTQLALPSGTSGSRIIIAGYPGEVAQLRRINVTTAQYLTFRNLNLTIGTSVTNVVSSNPPVPGDNFIRFEDVRITWVAPDVTSSDSTANFVFSNRNEYINMKIHGATNLGDGRSHGFYVNGANNLIDGCVIDNMTGYGIQIYNGYTFTHAHSNIIRNTTVHHTGQGTINTGGILLSSGTANKAYNNLVYSVQHSGMGLHVNYQCVNCAAYNNTIHRNSGYGVYVGVSATGTKIQNNILYENVATAIQDDGVSTTKTPNFTTPNPQFLNAGIGDFRLGATSPAINTGITVSDVTTDFLGVTRPQGAAYEPGAYEFVEGPPASTIEPPIPLLLTYLCNFSPNIASIGVFGSLFYVPTGATFAGTDLIQASCTSSSVMTDTASVVGSGFPTVRPFVFKGTMGPNADNVCTNCLSVHAGSVSVNEANSGWTLTNFREGSSLTSATGGTSAFSLLPGLCFQYQSGVLTSTPLWPWPMDARIQQARAASGRPPVDVTGTVESLLGPIPQSCITQVVPPHEGVTWYIATDGVDGGDCSQASPCATLNHVFGRMSGGHTVYLRGGTYSQRILTSSNPIPGGSSWMAPTIIAAFANETVILQVDTNRVVQFDTPATDRYIVLDRLILDGNAASSTTSVGLQVSNGVGPIRFQNGVIRNTELQRVLVNNVSDVEILNSTIHGGTEQAALQLTGPITIFRLTNSTIHSSPDVGVKMLGSMIHQALFDKVTVRDNAGDGVELGAGTAILRNSLVHSNGGLGVQALATCDPCKILHTTIADNAGDELRVDSGATGTIITNTIVVAGIVNNGTGTVGTNNLLTDPGFVGSGNYRIASGSSPAVDNGTVLSVAEVGTESLDGTPRVQGAAPDIGGYEFASGLAAPSEVRVQPWAAWQLYPLPY